MCLCSVISVNPGMPVSRWHCLVKLHVQCKKYFHCKVVSRFKETGLFYQKRLMTRSKKVKD